MDWQRQLHEAEREGHVEVLRRSRGGGGRAADEKKEDEAVVEEEDAEEIETELQRVARFRLQSLSAVMNDPTQRASSASSSNLPPWRPTATGHVRSSSAMGSSVLVELERQIAEWQQLQQVFEQNHAPQEEVTPETFAAAAAENGIAHSIHIVPKVYFQEDFSLVDPETFEQTCQALGSSSTVLQQEKLSHYLDVVEVELVRQVSTRSGSFFAALTTLQGLHQEVASTCEAITSVRRKMGAVRDDHVRQALQITALRQRKLNCIAVYKKLKLIARIRAAQPTIQLLLANSDFAGALDLIATTQAILASDLQGIQSFKHTSLQLKEMTNLIQRMIQDDFLRFALGKSSEIADAMRAHPVTTLFDSDEMEKEQLFHEVGLEERLSPLAFGLLRLGKIRQALQIYREKMQKRISSTIDRYVENYFQPSAATGQVADEISVLLLNMDPSVFLIHFLLPLFSLVLLRIERMAYIHGILLPVLDSCVGKQEQSIDPKPNTIEKSNSKASGKDRDEGSTSSTSGSAKWWGQARITISEEYRNQILFDSMETLSSILEIAHSRCARLIKMRAESNARLSTTEFVDLYNVSMQFVIQGEKLCKKQCFSLRNGLLSQGRLFLDSFHNNRISSMTIILESETWTLAEVALEFQQMATDIASPINAEVMQSIAIRNKKASNQRLQQMKEKVKKHEQRELERRSESVAKRAELTSSKESTSASSPVETANAATTSTTTAKKTTAVSEATTTTTTTSSLTPLTKEERRLAPSISAAMSFLSASTSSLTSSAPSSPSLSSSPTSSSPLALGESLLSKFNFRKITQNIGTDASGASKPSVSTADSKQDVSRSEPTGTVKPTKEEAVAKDTSDKDTSLGSKPTEQSVLKKSAPVETAASAEDEGASNASVAMELVIDDRKFHVVNAALIMVKLVEEYLNCLSLIPSLSTDILQKMVELLSLFNSRTCTLVLGAGAMQAASLKSITAKHLALAAESVGVEVALIPHIKARIGHYLAQKKHVLLNDLDRILGDCKEHRQQIFTKVVMIMKDRTELHTQSFTRSYSTSIAKSTSQYVLTLMKETTTLYRVLSKILPAAEIKHIFTSIVDMFNTRFTQHLNSLESLTPTGKKRLYSDLEYILQGLKGLSADIDPGNKLLTTYTSRFGPPPQQQQQS